MNALIYKKSGDELMVTAKNSTMLSSFEWVLSIEK